jgi:hypothetical protein
MLIRVAVDNNVAPGFLEFIGVMDCKVIGKMLWCFNIEDPKHPRYKSTITFTQYIKKEDSND